MDWYLRDGGRARARVIALAIALLMVVGGCGEQPSENTEADEPELSPREQQIQEFKDLDLEPGETLDGIHLMPWIQVFELERSLDDELISDVEKIYSDKRPDQSRIHRVTFHGELAEELNEYEGLLADDIIIGKDFMLIVGEARQKGDTLVVEASPLDLGRLFHGDWDFDINDAIIGEPHEDEPQYDGNPMLAATYEQGGTFGISSGGASGSVSAISGFDIGHFFSNLEATGDISFDGDARFRGRISVSWRDNFDNTDTGVCERGFWRRARETFSGSVCIQELALWAELDIEFLLQSELKYTDSISGGASFDFLDSVPDAQWPVFGAVSVTLGPFLKVGLTSQISKEVIYDWAEGVQGNTRFGFDYNIARDDKSLLIFPFDNGQADVPVSGIGRHESAGVEPKADAEVDESVVSANTSLSLSYGHSLGLALTGSNSAASAKISGMDFYDSQVLRMGQRFFDMATFLDSDCFHWVESREMGIDWSLTAQVKFGWVSLSGRPGFVGILTDWANDWTNFALPQAGTIPIDYGSFTRGTISIDDEHFPPKCLGLEWRVPDPTKLVIHGEAEDYTNQSIQEYLFADDPQLGTSGDAEDTDAETLLSTGNSTFNQGIGSLNLNRYFGSDYHDIEFNGGFNLRPFGSQPYDGPKNIFYLVLHNRRSPSDGPMDMTIYVDDDSPRIPGRPAVRSIGGVTNGEYQFSLDADDFHVVEIEFQRVN